MPAEIACPGCNNKLTLPDDFAGQRVQCPKCHVDFAALATPVPAMEVDSQAQAEKPAGDGAAPRGDGQAMQADRDTLGNEKAQTAYIPASKSVSRSTVTLDSSPIYCTECGTKFARTEDACPSCGYSVHALADERHFERRRPHWRDVHPPRGYLSIVGAVLWPLGAAFIIGGIIAIEAVRRAPPGMRFWIPLLLFGMGAAIAVTAVVFCLTWLYQAWRAVLVGDEDYSPGLMVGLLFVPIFNLFWMFRAIPGLSAAIHEELKLFAPTRARSTGWIPGLAACVIALIPFPPAWAVALCMFVAWMLIVNNAIYRLARFHRQLRAQTESEAAERFDTAP